MLGMKAREHRQKVLIRAKLRAGGLPMDACIRDISSKGMMIHSKAPPPRGTYVEVITATQTIVGRVVWGADMRFGINTREKLHIEMIIGELRTGRSPSEPPPVTALRRPQVPKRESFTSAHAKALEFCGLVVFAVAIIYAIASATYETLSSPLENISAQMRVGG
jgi:hypothetical protein